MDQLIASEVFLVREEGLEEGRKRERKDEVVEGWAWWSGPRGEDRVVKEEKEEGEDMVFCMVGWVVDGRIGGGESVRGVGKVGASGVG